MINSNENDSFAWKTKVEYGSELAGYISAGKKYSGRECFAQLQEFAESDVAAKICALFGLSGTGKTILFYQLMSVLDSDTTAYIHLSPGNDMPDLEHDLMQLLRLGFKTVLIENITYAKDFASNSSLLADYYAVHGMKIIASGTDSSGFLLAAKHTLYDRIILIHTTHISFKEHTRLLHNDLDYYMRWGGTLLAEAESPFAGIAASTEYMNSAIVQNIQNAFGVLDDDPDFYTSLKNVYYDEQLTNLINRILDDTRRQFAERICSLHGQSDVEDIVDLLVNNRETLAAVYSTNFSIDNNYAFSPTNLTELKQYLLGLDVLSSCKTVYEDYSEDTRYIFTQPGIQYSQATALIAVCESLPDFKKLSTGEASGLSNSC